MTEKPFDVESEVDAILTDTYACTRVWEAWGYGTMTEDDFVPAVETEVRSDLLTLVNNAVAAALVEQAAELYAEAKRLTSKLDSVPDATAFAVGAANGALTKQARRMEALAAELRGEQS